MICEKRKSNKERQESLLAGTHINNELPYWEYNRREDKRKLKQEKMGMKSIILWKETHIKE